MTTEEYNVQLYTLSWIREQTSWLHRVLVRKRAYRHRRIWHARPALMPPTRLFRNGRCARCGGRKRNGLGACWRCEARRTLALIAVNPPTTPSEP